MIETVSVQQLQETSNKIIQMTNRLTFKKNGPMYPVSPLKKIPSANNMYLRWHYYLFSLKLCSFAVHLLHSCRPGH